MFLASFPPSNFGMADVPVFFCGDIDVGGESSLASRLPLEKSSFRRTFVDAGAAVFSTFEARAEDGTGPREGLRRAGEFRYVFIGDFDFGGGSRMLVDILCAITAVGSGIVPIEVSQLNAQSGRCAYSLLHPSHR